MIEALASIYTALAETLTPLGVGDLPGWLAAPGRDWPLFFPATELAARNSSPAWRDAILAVAEVGAASLASRQVEYEALFVGIGSPPVWLYESYYENGRLLGPATFQVKKLYTQAGLEVNSAELPDHAALELTFLAFLTAQESQANGHAGEWLAVRNLFIKNHAGRWLPTVGETLIRSPYPAWAAIGHLLIASLVKARPAPGKQEACAGFPVITQAGNCTLCGFCVQACPTRALVVHEDEATTILWMIPEKCVHCNKCTEICTENALQLSSESQPDGPIPLCESPRSNCPMCGTPTVSQAELEAIVTQLGEHPRWLDYCLDCRSYQMELNQ